jgi:hypothetical protein
MTGYSGYSFLLDWKNALGRLHKLCFSIVFYYNYYNLYNYNNINNIN